MVHFILWGKKTTTLVDDSNNGEDPSRGSPRRLQTQVEKNHIDRYNSLKKQQQQQRNKQKTPKQQQQNKTKNKHAIEYAWR